MRSEQYNYIIINMDFVRCFSSNSTIEASHPQFLNFLASPWPPVTGGMEIMETINISTCTSSISSSSLLVVDRSIISKLVPMAWKLLWPTTGTPSGLLPNYLVVVQLELEPT
jgi:hypothetical protein